jgi:adenylate kinase family enzyme
MNRIMIIGCGGSGKSFLARKLGQSLSLPVYHLDRIFWKKGWVESERAPFLESQQRILSTHRWIVDGNFGGTMELRFKHADTIIFLDLSTAVCLWSVVKRRFQYRNQARPDMTEGNNERLDSAFLRWIFSFRRIYRSKILSRLQSLIDHKKIVILTTRRAVDCFIEETEQKS